jgi:hypothetical protein
MGVTLGPSFTTLNGIEIQELYLSLANARFVLLGNGNIQSIFIFEAYASRNAKKNGSAPIQLSIGQNIGELIVTTSNFISQNIFTLAYESIKSKFNGYNIVDIFEPGQSSYLNYRFNIDGYDMYGFDKYGYNTQGYDHNGYNKEGYSIDGFNSLGFDAQGYDRQGFNSAGVDREGYNTLGYNTQGYNRQGYDVYGYNTEGYNAEGYNSQGFDSTGYNAQGYNTEGLSINGGYNSNGYLLDGTLAPFPSTIIAYNTVFPDRVQSFDIRSDPDTIANLMNILSAELKQFFDSLPPINPTPPSPAEITQPTEDTPQPTQLTEDASQTPNTSNV